ncbi:MAG: putative LPS assembly protein LptD [Bacteroidota bacterium]
MLGLRSIVFFFLIITFFSSGYAQEISESPEDKTLDSLETVYNPDSLSLPVDSLSADSLKTSAKPKPKGDIETTINYNAKDSMFYDMEHKKIFMYQDAHIDYGDIVLEANETEVDWNIRTIKAKYALDSTGHKVGKPVFTQEGDTYETDDITYNFKTRRAIIKGVITEQEGAFMHGEDVKMNEEKELFIKHAKYTTCNLEDPHFFLMSEKLKVIPGNKVVSGPFSMWFRDIPTPFWFPFGMFPQPRKKATGIVFPSYGEEKQRGFFLRDGGYYLTFSDYMDLKLTGSIYSKGGHGLTANMNYKKRYSYAGSFNFSYNKSIIDNIENPLETNDFWIRWSHRPETRGNSSFGASVSAGTSTYNSNNNMAISSDPSSFQRSINSQFSSSVSYSQRFQRIPVNMSANLRHNQNVQTGVMTMTLPDFTMNVNRIYPFKSVIKNQKNPLAKISFSHNFAAKNEVTNAPVRGFSNFEVVNLGEESKDTLAFNLENFERLYDRAKIGGRHSIPVSTSFNMFNYITVSPSFNYTELWYTRELDFTYDEQLNGVRVDTLDGFSRTGWWTSGASMNTRFYGTVTFPGQDRKIQAIRHVVTPSIGFSYNPDFSVKSGVYKEIQTDSTGRMVRVSKYEQFAYGGPPSGESRTISFSLQNNLEMKVRDDKDSTQAYKKVKIFENLSVSTGYNLAAEEFKLSNINWNTRTSLFRNKINVALNGTFDPYVYNLISEKVNPVSGARTVVQERIDRYAWNNGQGLGNLSRLSTSLGFSLNSKSGGRKDPEVQDQFDTGTIPGGLDESTYGTEEEKEFIRQNPEQYVNFDVPWTFRVQYSVSRTQVGYQDAQITQSMQFSGTLALTDKTQITYNSGFDFVRKEFTTTRIGVSRDLHCWSMNFSWVPFGRYQSFSLVIAPNSSLLQDLKLEKRRNFFDFFNR